ncbi:hypothetical protein [Actinoplanes sp. NPDC051851]|uniref:hypothetical protein n=1 Tax=Actinoplanes sp. NPDC051851 TaxID=3154753 RepID=UPI0034342164
MHKLASFLPYVTAIVEDESWSDEVETAFFTLVIGPAPALVASPRWGELAMRCCGSFDASGAIGARIPFCRRTVGAQPGLDLGSSPDPPHRQGRHRNGEVGAFGELLDALAGQAHPDSNLSCAH